MFLFYNVYSLVSGLWTRIENTLARSLMHGLCSSNVCGSELWKCNLLDVFSFSMYIYLDRSIMLCEINVLGSDRLCEHLTVGVLK